MLYSFLLLAQQQTETQTEYYLGYGLVVAMILLGMLVVCIPRPRAKHFVEPEEGDDDAKKKKKPKRRV